MSWAPQVVADDSGKWTCNALRFATEAEALANAHDLECRWLMVRRVRAVETPDPVNHEWIGGRLIPLLSGRKV